MDEFSTSNAINTKRLLLRFIEPSDKHNIFININNDKEVLSYFLDKYYEKEEDFSLDNLISYAKENKLYIFSIVEKASGEVIGLFIQCSNPNKYFNSVELGFALGKKYWNKGYASEALKAAIDFYFDLGISKIYCSCIKENIASEKVMQHCGMTFESIRIKDVYYRNKYWDSKFYYILNPNVEY